MPIAVGQTFERYEIESLIGRGGMGDVYRAVDTRLRRKVALKVLRPDREGDEAVARLFREARSAAVLSHPNTVAIHDIGEAEGIFYIVMELVTGAPLLTYVGDDRVPVARKLGWLVDIARALSAAHKADVIHRDVKPSNVMVSDEGVVKVLDFGLAKSLAPMSFRTQHGHVLGTPRYMSPEQVTGGEVDARSDQYAFALTAYELIAGKHPGGVLAGPTVPPALHTLVPEVTIGVSQVVAQAMASKPEERFATMEEVVTALEDAIAGRPVRGLALGPPGASVAAMSAAPETIAESKPFGASAPPPPATGEPDPEVDRPTITARPTEAALADRGDHADPAAPPAEVAASTHVASTTMMSADAAPEPVGRMRTLLSADAARIPLPAAAPAPSAPAPAPGRQVPAASSGRRKSPWLLVGVAVLGACTFAGAYLGSRTVTGAAAGAASASASATPPVTPGAEQAAAATLATPHTAPHGTVVITPLVATPIAPPSSSASPASSGSAPATAPTGSAASPARATAAGRGGALAPTLKPTAAFGKPAPPAATAMPTPTAAPAPDTPLPNR